MAYKKPHGTPPKFLNKETREQDAQQIGELVKSIMRQNLNISQNQLMTATRKANNTISGYYMYFKRHGTEAPL